MGYMMYLLFVSKFRYAFKNNHGSSECFLQQMTLTCLKKQGILHAPTSSIPA